MGEESATLMAPAILRLGGSRSARQVAALIVWGESQGHDPILPAQGKVFCIMERPASATMEGLEGTVCRTGSQDDP